MGVWRQGWQPGAQQQSRLWRGGYEIWPRASAFAAAVPEAVALSACLPFPGPLRVAAPPSRASSALEGYMILGKLLSVSGPSFGHLCIRKVPA